MKPPAVATSKDSAALCAKRNGIEKAGRRCDVKQKTTARGGE
jgi:hypothetical protein